MRILLNNATLITREKVNILIDNGMIVKVSKEKIDIPVDTNYNLDKKIIMPGLIDMKPCSRFSDVNEWTISKESDAYIKGGITSILEFPFEENDSINFNDLLWKNIDNYNKKSYILFSFSNSTNLGFKLGEFKKNQYTITTRLFLSGIKVKENDPESIKNFILKINEVCDKSNSVLISMKDENINFFFKYFKNKNANIGIFDISSEQEVKRINVFKENGFNFFSIINIDNFFINQEMLHNHVKKTKFKSACSFPTKKSMNNLLTSLMNNEIDIVIANHIPTKILEKFEFNKIGNPGAETFIPLIFDIVLYYGIDLDIINNVLFNNVRKFLKLKDRFQIKEGAVADFVVVDIDKFWYVTESDIISTAKWSQYEGKRFWGVPILTFINGSIAYDESSERKFFTKNIKSKLLLGSNKW